MGRIIRKRNKRPGTPPGSLVFTGERKRDAPTVALIDYGPDHLEERAFDDLDELDRYQAQDSITWINVLGLHDVDLLERFGSRFQLHPLVMEDVASTGQRPKVEPYTDYLYIVLKMMRYDEAKRELDVEQVSLILSNNYVLTFQEHVGDVFDPVRERLRSGRGNMRRAGADYLAYALIDVIVDNYFLVLEGYGDEIEQLEDDLMDHPTANTQHRLRALRSHLIVVRRAVWPIREMLGQLDREESGLIRDSTRPFLRDVYDHAVQVIDVTESLRDLLNGLMDLYMSSLSNRMNEIMKVLTIFGTIFLPISFIAGVYGMNFDRMPELHTTYGYPIALLVMALISAVLLIFFRRKRWL